jgi:DNA-binding transcriptional LysR family regulator
LPYFRRYDLPHPELDLRQLHAFLVLAEELHFGRAALRLGIAQPPLSQQIQRLERRVGHPLLVRGGATRLALTPAGRAMLPAARHALAELERGLGAARRAARGETGLLRVGFTPSIALTFLPPLVRDFRMRFPGVELQLSEHASAVQLELIRASRLDLGFLRDPPPEADLSSRAVASEPLIALLPRTHRLASARRVRLSDLATDPFLLVRAAAGPSFRTRLLEFCRGAGFEPAVAQEAGEWSTVAGLVSAGLGVALAPASVARISLPGMVHRPLIHPLQSRIVLFWNGAAEDEVLRNFVDLSAKLVIVGVGRL